MSHQADPQPTDSRNTSTPRRVLIVGGVAGGASCAARLRRLDESVEIAMFDRGPYVSFANCGLPYYVGNVIPDERTLLVSSREMFRERFNIEVQTETEVAGIDRGARTISVRDLRSRDSRPERYDVLVANCLPILFCQFRYTANGLTVFDTATKCWTIPMCLISPTVSSDNVTLLHEVGHAAGLDHDKTSTDPKNRNFMHEAVTRTTMFQWQIQKMAQAFYAKP